MRAPQCCPSPAPPFHWKLPLPDCPAPCTRRKDPDSCKSLCKVRPRRGCRRDLNPTGCGRVWWASVQFCLCGPGCDNPKRLCGEFPCFGPFCPNYSVTGTNLHSSWRAREESGHRVIRPSGHCRFAIFDCRLSFADSQLVICDFRTSQLRISFLARRFQVLNSWFGGEEIGPQKM